MLDNGQRLQEHFALARARTLPPSFSVLCGISLPLDEDLVVELDGELDPSLEDKLGCNSIDI